MKKTIIVIIVSALVFCQSSVFSQNTQKLQLADTTDLQPADSTQLPSDSVLAEDSLEKDLPSFRDTIVLPKSLGVMGRVNDSIHKTIQFHGHTLISDSPLVHALDSLAYVKFYKKGFLLLDSASMKKSKFNPGQVPSYPDSVYAKRIAALNVEHPSSWFTTSR